VSAEYFHGSLRLSKPALHAITDTYFDEPGSVRKVCNAAIKTPSRSGRAMLMRSRKELGDIGTVSPGKLQ
jgi:hypothetical protein